MNDIYIGVAISLALIGMTEILTFLEKRLIGALTLVGIPFIYIGFAIHDLPSLLYSISGVAFFVALAYLGYKNNFILIVLGLILHGIWDILFPLISSTAPEGYGVFCLTVDLILALYFYLRVKPAKISMRSDGVGK